MVNSEWNPYGRGVSSLNESQGAFQRILLILFFVVVFYKHTVVDHLCSVGTSSLTFGVLPEQQSDPNATKPIEQ